MALRQVGSFIVVLFHFFCSSTVPTLPATNRVLSYTKKLSPMQLILSINRYQLVQWRLITISARKLRLRVPVDSQTIPTVPTISTKYLHIEYWYPGRAVIEILSVHSSKPKFIRFLKASDNPVCECHLEKSKETRKKNSIQPVQRIDPSFKDPLPLRGSQWNEFLFMKIGKIHCVVNWINDRLIQNRHYHHHFE